MTAVLKNAWRLRPAAFLKLGMENSFPRAVISTKVGRSVLTRSQPVGPFPSKAAAERYLEEVLNLFLLRRCIENLVPDPEPSGVFIFRDEKVPRALLRRLHAGALPAGSG